MHLRPGDSLGSCTGPGWGGRLCALWGVEGLIFSEQAGKTEVKGVLIMEHFHFGVNS